MFNQIKTWLASHATAILATALAVMKAGLLGKVALLVATTLAAAVG